MSVYKRGDIWWVQIFVPGQPKAVRRSSRSTKRRDAVQLERTTLEEIAGQQRRGVLGLKPQRSFEDAMVKYLESGNAKKSMASHIKAVARDLRHASLEEDTMINAVATMKQDLLNKGLSPQTVNRRLSVVQRVLNLAHREWRWLERPLAEFIGPMKTGESEYQRHVYLTAAQVEMYFKRVKNPEAKRALFALVFTGLRVSELFRLTPDNWTGAAIRLTSKTKGKRPRSIPVMETARPLFESLPFKTNHNTLRYWIEKARGNDDVRIHDLRHTFASWLVDDPNIPLAMVRDILGHCNLSVTSRYSHIRNERLSIIEDALPKLDIT
jgi:integrase